MTRGQTADNSITDMQHVRQIVTPTIIQTRQCQSKGEISDGIHIFQRENHWSNESTMIMYADNTLIHM